MSDFVSLYTAFSGLQAAQAALDTASHNIANVGTDGYTRQRVELGSRIPHQQPFGPVGTGVSVEDITRSRNEFLDVRYRDSVAGERLFTTLGELLGGIEASLGEPDHGITSTLGSLWNAFEDVALDPPDTAARMAVLGGLEAVAEQIRGVATAWDQAAADVSESLDATIADVNRHLDEIASLNRSILEGRGAPGSPNDLLDERDRLIDRLAALAGVTATVTDSGAARVSLNGLALVHDTAVSHLSRDGDGSLVHPSGAPVDPGGELAGRWTFLDVEFPAHRAALDTFAADLADALNAQHAAGYTLDGVAGGLLLDYSAGAAASTLAVAVTGPDDLAAASSAGPPVPAFDGTNIDALVALRLDLVAGGGTSTIDDAARALVGGVASATAAARSAATSQRGVSAAAAAARTEAHAVSIDEEMVNLLTFQRAYEAAARVMTAVDQTLDTLINRTGVVGR